MSIIIGVKKNDKVYLGADTQTTCGDNVKKNFNKNNLKINLYPSGIILGHVGSVEFSSHVKELYELFELKEGTKFDKEYVVKQIANGIYHYAKENHFLSGEDEFDPQVPCSFYVAYKDKLFIIQHNLAVLEIPECDSIGAPHYITPYYDKFIKSDDIKSDMVEAMSNESHLINTVRGPFILIDTDNKKFEVREGN